MFNYIDNYDNMKKDLYSELQQLEALGYMVLSEKHKIIDDLFVDKITIRKQKTIKNRLIFSSGLHGIEGYVGHSCLKVFFKELLCTLQDDTEVVIYHGVNPFGMKHFRRTNENNIDLNGNFTNNNFQNTNKGFDLLIDFFTPKVNNSKILANFSYYLSLMGLLKNMVLHR